MATDFLKEFTMQTKAGIIDTGFMGTTKYELVNLLEEHYNPARHDITGVFEGFRFDTNTNERTHCVIMICEQLNPGLLDKANQPTEANQSPQQSSTCSTCYWENRLIFDSCFNPYDNNSFIENIDHIQSPDGSFPGGYLHIFAAAIPSAFKPISGIPSSLTEDDLFAIKLGLCMLPAYKRDFIVSTSSSCFFPSSYACSDVSMYDMAAIWYNRDTKRIWVAENTVSNWYVRESEKRTTTTTTMDSAQKSFEEFWMRFVKRWEYCRRKWGHDVDIQKLSCIQLCLRDRGNDSSSKDRGSSASSPSSEKGWTMIEGDSASS